MRGLNLLALIVISLLASGCAKPQTADPTPILSRQSDLARIRQAILPCLKKAWAPPGKGPFPRLTLRWQLDEDGKLVGDPEVVDTKSSPYQPAVQAATRAVYACEPYKLRMSEYHLWKEIVLNFDPGPTAD